MSESIRVVSIFVGLLCLNAVPASAQQSAEEMLQSALYKQEIEGDLAGAIALFETITEQHPDNRAVAARALLHLGLAYETLGLREAERAYRGLLSNYPEQSDAVNRAMERLAALSPNTPVEPSGLVAHRLWRSSAILPGALSPNGREVAEVLWSDFQDEGDLGVMSLETGELRIVGKTRGRSDGGDTYVEAFAWSPSGDRIAYSEVDVGVRGARKTHHMDLHVVDADGSGHRIVSDDTQNVKLYPRAWSSDGSWIAALIKGRDDVSRIATISMDDGAVTLLKTLPAGTSEGQEVPTWTISVSPDDRYLAYAFSPSVLNKPDIHILAVDGSSESVVAPNVATDVNPLWTPDGSRLVFLSDRSGSADLWAVEMSDGSAVGEPRLIQPHLGPVALLGFTADGALSYRSQVPATYMQVVSIDADWKFESSEPLSDRFVGHISGASVSPDGSQIAYLASRWPGFDEKHFVVLKSFADKRERDIELPSSFRPAHRGTRLEWSSDGERIMLRADHVERTETGVVSRVGGYTIDAQSGEFRREPYLWDFAGGWLSCCSHRFASGRQSDGLRELGVRIIGLGGKSDWSLISTGEEPLRSGESMLWIGPSQSGSFRGSPFRFGFQLATGGDGAQAVVQAIGLNSWELSPDGTRIAYLELQGESWRLLVVPVTLDEEPTVIQSGQQDEPVGDRSRIRWTPDGSHLIYAIGEGIYRIEAGGGEPEALHWEISQDQLGEMELFPDGRHALIPVFNPDGPPQELWTLSGFPWQTEDQR